MIAEAETRSAMWVAGGAERLHILAGIFFAILVPRMMGPDTMVGYAFSLDLALFTLMSA